MNIISTVYKKTKLGGKRLCNIRFINTDSKDLAPREVTEWVAERYGLIYKHGSIEIHNGSGTGFMRLEALMKKDNPRCPVFNVSVFNQ